MLTATSKYVVWDFDGTLAHRPEMWSGAVLAAVRAAGLTCGAVPEDVRPFLQSGFPWQQPDVTRAPGCHPDDWWAALEPVFARAIRSLTQGDEIVSTRAARRVREFYTDPCSWELYADVCPVLDAFARTGWKQVVLSNHVPELPLILDGLGLSRYLVRIFNSAVTGVEKPNPIAYRQVLEIVPNGSSVWMVGDTFSADVLGAEAAGMNAILVRSVHPLAKRSCRSLTETLAILTGA